jgi:hypothetical protein
MPYTPRMSRIKKIACQCNANNSRNSAYGVCDSLEQKGKKSRITTRDRIKEYKATQMQPAPLQTISQSSSVGPKRSNVRFEFIFEEDK